MYISIKLVIYIFNFYVQEVLQSKQLEVFITDIDWILDYDRPQIDKVFN